MARMPQASLGKQSPMVNFLILPEDHQLRCVSNLAKDHDFDVVLIDTAGRMQDNEVHYSCLSSFLDLLMCAIASHACPCQASGNK